MNLNKFTSRGQNTEENVEPDLSPIIRVSIKSRSSQRNLNSKSARKIPVKTEQEEVKKENRVNVRLKYFQLKGCESKRCLTPLTESRSAAGKGKVGVVKVNSPSIVYGLSKSYKKTTRFYMRNHEICNFLKDKKRGVLKSSFFSLQK